jgi:hypothetical protein
MPLPLPTILGRPFMITGDTKFCGKECTLSMKVNGEKIEFKVFDALKLPQDTFDYFHVYIIQNDMEEVFQVHHIDPIKAILIHSFTRQDIEPAFEDITDDIIEALSLHLI